MRDLKPRFSYPINVPRPRGGRLIEGFSPKLGRRVQLFDHATFAVWIGLEAAPSVVSLCERPTRLGLSPNDPAIDFWVRHGADEKYLVVPDNGANLGLPGHVGGIEVTAVLPGDIAAARAWIANWQRILPVINATRASISKATAKMIRRFVSTPTPLAVIEHQFRFGDPTLIRGTIFELLRTGQLMAPTLHWEPLSLHTVMEPSA